MSLAAMLFGCNLNLWSSKSLRHQNRGAKPMMQDKKNEFITETVLRMVFESGVREKGLSTDRCEFQPNQYDDNYVEEAWRIFKAVPLEGLMRVVRELHLLSGSAISFCQRNEEHELTEQQMETIQSTHRSPQLEAMREERDTETTD